jgi:hypothetical protein
MTGCRRNTEESGNERSASDLQDHDALNPHENEISGHQNHVTAMPGHARSFANSELEAKPV